MGKLTTHVLDTSNGSPASDLSLQLWSLTDVRSLLVETRTNSDGRVDAPLLEGDAFNTGKYELVFQAGEYFRRNDANLSDIPFLDDVVLRFGVSDSSVHYHVPLLLSPFGYTTYRGS